MQTSEGEGASWQTTLHTLNHDREIEVAYDDKKVEVRALVVSISM